MKSGRMSMYRAQWHDQLPVRVRDQLFIILYSDSHHLRTRIRLLAKDGRKFECALDQDYKMPDHFVAHLCAVV